MSGGSFPPYKRGQLKACSARETKFARLRASGLGLALAVEKAGYSPRGTRGQGFKLEKRPHVAAAIAKYRDEREARDEVLAAARAELPERLYLKLRDSQSTSDPKSAHRVLAGLRAGLTLTSALAETGIVRSTWNGWLEAHPELREIQLKALEVGSHALALECLEIADYVIEERDAVAKAKLRIETRLKLIAAWNRQFYGQEVVTQANHTFVINADLSGEKPALEHEP